MSRSLHFLFFVGLGGQGVISFLKAISAQVLFVSPPSKNYRKKKMVASRVLSRLSNGFRAFASSASRKELLPSYSRASFNEGVLQQMTQYSFPRRGILQQFGLSSSAFPQSNEKENQFKDGQGRFVDKGDVSMNISEEEADMESNIQSGYIEASDQGEHPDTEDVLSVDDLVKLVAEKQELLKVKQEEVEQMKDKVLRSYAEMENVMERTKREAENSKKFAIQSFAKSLLDVADNLGRASSVVKDSFSKLDQSKGSAAVPLLKTLLEGVEMTDKQLTEVFRKFGVEKFDPINEQFDPNRHNALFQVPDASKPAGTVAAVLKCGYVLYDRVIRPAEVGVTEAASNEEAVVQSSEHEARRP